MAIFKIDEDLRDSVIEALEQASSTWYCDSNGPWGFECPFCLRRSTDGESPPPHDEDCEAMPVGLHYFIGVNMKRRLSVPARILLSALINNYRDDWWDVVPSKGVRTKALDELLKHNLVEVRKETNECRATKLGHISHQLARDAGLIKTEKK